MRQIILTVLSIPVLAGAQITPEEYRAKMDALNQRTRPVTRPAATVTDASVDVPMSRSGSQRFTWKAKDDAPPEIKEWVDSFPLLRVDMRLEIDKLLTQEREALTRASAKAREEIGLKKKAIERLNETPIPPRRVREGLVYMSRPDHAAIAARNEKRRQLEREIVDLWKVVRAEETGSSERHKELSKLRDRIDDTAAIPVWPLTTLTIGRVGTQAGPLVIEQVVDRRSAICSYQKSVVWLSGFDTFGMTRGDSINVDGALRVTQRKAFNNMAGGSRVVVMLEAFAYEQFMEKVPEGAVVAPRTAIAAVRPAQDVPPRPAEPTPVQPIAAVQPPAPARPPAPASPLPPDDAVEPGKRSIFDFDSGLSYLELKPGMTLDQAQRTTDNALGRKSAAKREATNTDGTSLYTLPVVIRDVSEGQEKFRAEGTYRLLVKDDRIIQATRLAR